MGINSNLVSNEIVLDRSEDFDTGTENRDVENLAFPPFRLGIVFQPVRAGPAGPLAWDSSASSRSDAVWRCLSFVV